jgi:hypothetical protein
MRIASNVASSVHPPSNIKDIDGNTAKHGPLPPAAITSLEQRRGSISERTHEIECCNLAATLAANSRPQRANRNAKMQRAEAARTHPPIGMTTNVRGEPASGHPIRRGEVASSDHEPETRSKREKHPPRHARDYAAYRATTAAG